MTVVFLILFLAVLFLWIYRIKQTFSIKDKKKYEESRDDLIDDMFD
jgi:hypothetical protein